MIVSLVDDLIWSLKNVWITRRVQEQERRERKTEGWCYEKTVKSVICFQIDKGSLTLKYSQLSETLFGFHTSTMVGHRC